MERGKQKDYRDIFRINKEKQFYTYLGIAFVILLCIFFTLGFMFGKVTSKDYACIQNPLGYGLEQFNEVNDEEYNCFCQATYNPAVSFSFDRDIFTFQVNDNKNIDELNFSKIYK